MELPKALEERTFLTGCYGLRQFTTLLRLFFPWTVCILLCQRSHSLLSQPPTPTFSTFFPRTKTDWRQRSEEMKTQKHPPIPIFVIITLSLSNLANIISTDQYDRGLFCMWFFFQFRTKLDRDSVEEFLDTTKVQSPCWRNTQPPSRWNGQCPWEFISLGSSWNYLKGRSFQDETLLFITQMKIKEIKQ